MEKICHQCQVRLITDCQVTVEGGLYGIKISKKGKGLFKKASAKPKAAVCPSCGYTALYIENPEAFNEII